MVDRHGKVIGVVSESDLLARKGTQVKSIMTKNVIRVMEDTPVEEIATLMATQHVKRLPVIRGQKLAGIVSRGDIVRALAVGEHPALHTPVYDL